jgi:SPX domain protein involved in polyphosphate accumulation
MSEQLIFKRHEMKYMISRSQLELIKDGMKEHMIADVHGKSTILSLYYDTPDFRLIRKSMERPVYKEKLRLRSYGLAGEDSQVFVELKKKYDSVVYKRRIGMTKKQADDYLVKGKKVSNSQISREVDYFLDMYEDVRPAVLLSYEREAFYDKDNHEFRVTFDDNILWRDYNLTLDSGIYGTSILAPDKVLMEVKTADAVPLWFVNLLSSNHIYQTSFSKYGTAYTTLYNKQINGGNYKYA